MLYVEMLICGFALDLVLADPPSWPHPVKLIGKLIALFTWIFNRDSIPSWLKQIFGAFIWIVTVGLSFGSVLLVMWLFTLISNNTQVVLLFQFIFGSYISYTCLSVKGLADAAKSIVDCLRADDLTAARNQVGMIVGRDTETLSKEEVCKATIETVAENTCDGVIAPMIYLAIGGPALGIAYKAVNTLDSMIGYKDKKYADIGKVSALLDDVFNYVPARVTWLVLLLAVRVLGYDFKDALAVGRKDRENHSSPNSGFSESVVAGALNLTLGGPHTYFGKPVSKPFIGNGSQVAGYQEILKTNRILYVSALESVLIISIISIII
ncbi:adenosylcobinamide-phosphate synthase CbiB [Lentilactobacillus kosonis]|uniref:Cobalamin biosynthesis protein CobD n=1 Tax=Lentilactobacillus kosonis TaxID=2810561 RepID=A0A401FN29_9LACO|nr:adenosylcobinamide-phosphate synthase CbiB [Lentilactobacillus kosonis]GAY73668.1 adenosylcobinamide-phosphate synthase [Lentilactobacillus kosonis]